MGHAQQVRDEAGDGRRIVGRISGKISSQSEPADLGRSLSAIYSGNVSMCHNLTRVSAGLLLTGLRGPTSSLADSSAWLPMSLLIGRTYAAQRSCRTLAESKHTLLGYLRTA
jgi:hypothetical protein